MSIRQEHARQETLERRRMSLEEFDALPEDVRAEYLAAGVGQYWIVDPAVHALTVLRNAGEERDALLGLDAEHPTGELPVGEHGTVSIDLDALLAF